MTSLEVVRTRHHIRRFLQSPNMIPPVPRPGPLGHKTGVISDSRPGPLLINDDAIVPQGTSVEVIVLHLQQEASTRYY